MGLEEISAGEEVDDEHLNDLEFCLGSFGRVEGSSCEERAIRRAGWGGPNGMWLVCFVFSLVWFGLVRSLVWFGRNCGGWVFGCR